MSWEGITKFETDKISKFKKGDKIYIVIGRNMIAIRTIKAIILQDSVFYYSTGGKDNIYPEGCCFGSLGEAQNECSRRDKVDEV